MPQNKITYFTDDASVALRQGEVPAADFLGGCNMAAGASGIGIGIDAGPVEGTPEQFTLLDQHGDPRDPQISQNIGGPGYTDHADYPSSGGQEGTLPDSVIYSGPVGPNGDGTATRDGAARLQTLAAGWIAAEA